MSAVKIETSEDEKIGHKLLGTFDLRLGMYRGSSNVAGGDQEVLFERMRRDPIPYLRMYVMFPQAHLNALEKIKAATFDLEKLYNNRLFLTTRRLRGEMYWQLFSLYPGVKAFSTLANHYAKGMRSGQIHRDSKAKQFRTSFGLVANPFIIRAYQDFSGYAPFSHRALPVEFRFYEVPETGVVALSVEPIKTYVTEALAMRTRFPHLKIHSYPVKRLDEKFAAQATEAAKLVTPAKETSAAPPPPVEPSEPPVEPSEPPVAESVVPASSAVKLLIEGESLCELVNRWLLKMHAETQWQPELTTKTPEDGPPELHLNLHRRYGK